MLIFQQETQCAVKRNGIEWQAGGLQPIVPCWLDVSDNLRRQLVYKHTESCLAPQSVKLLSHCCE